jgi:hypothetical protein
MSHYTVSLSATNLLNSSSFIDAIRRNFEWVEDVHFVNDPCSLGYIMKIKAKDDFDYRWVMEDF